MKTLTFDFDNVPGIASMYAIPVSSFLQLRHDYLAEQAFVELCNREEIICIPVYAGDSFLFTEEQSLQEGGELWEVTIEGIIPRLYQPNEADIHRLERGDWLVLFQDSNGAALLAGTTEVPLKFSNTRTSGTGSQLNGSRFTFTGKESEPSRIVSNDVPNL